MSEIRAPDTGPVLRRRPHPRCTGRGHPRGPGRASANHVRYHASQRLQVHPICADLPELAASPRAIASASSSQWASLGDRRRVGLLVKGGSVGRARCSVIAIANRRLTRANQRASCSRQSRAANATATRPDEYALSRVTLRSHPWITGVGSSRPLDRTYRFEAVAVTATESPRHAIGLPAGWCGSNERMARVDDKNWHRRLRYRATGRGHHSRADDLYATATPSRAPPGRSAIRLGEPEVDRVDRLDVLGACRVRPDGALVFVPTDRPADQRTPGSAHRGSERWAGHGLCRRLAGQEHRGAEADERRRRRGRSSPARRPASGRR